MVPDLVLFLCALRVGPAPLVRWKVAGSRSEGLLTRKLLILEEHFQRTDAAGAELFDLLGRRDDHPMAEKGCREPGPVQPCDPHPGPQFVDCNALGHVGSRKGVRHHVSRGRESFRPTPDPLLDQGVRSHAQRGEGDQTPGCAHMVPDPFGPVSACLWEFLRSSSPVNYRYHIGAFVRVGSTPADWAKRSGTMCRNDPQGPARKWRLTLSGPFQDR
ncbi:hypothetical protein NITMOv2_2169 [Nitrospira moscoviensis]|uniref:Uncharacterized protein n=1 Tax=Nitrospira moscoviensis TaxID=42253 RepID=A0A0K2GC96_NITMO|nr:hypothetical protein NITMOv2_2169 [Nitrospira moscoviensis]